MWGAQKIFGGGLPRMLPRGYGPEYVRKYLSSSLIWTDMKNIPKVVTLVPHAKYKPDFKTNMLTTYTRIYLPFPSFMKRSSYNQKVLTAWLYLRFCFQIIRVSLSRKSVIG